MAEISIMLVVLLCAWALWRWQVGMLAVILAAVAEGPLRKLTADQPVLFVLMPALVFAAALFGASASGASIGLRHVLGWQKYLGTAFMVYAALVFLQAMNALLNTGNPLVPLFGVLAYLGPLIAVLFGYVLALRLGRGGLERLLYAYAAIMGVAVATIYLELAGVQSSLLGEVGEGLTITTRMGNLDARSGLFRASEIAAWHCGTVCCLLIALTVRRGLSVSRALVLILVLGLLIGAGIVTGRRKFLVVVVVFASAYIALLSVYATQAFRLAMAAVVLGLAGFMAVQTFEDVSDSGGLDRSVDYQIFLQRQHASFSEVPTRFVELGIAPIEWAMERVGPLGAGVGTAGQQARFLGIQGIGGGAAEGGLGKLVIEVGLPGLAVLAWVGVSFVRLVLAGFVFLSQQAAGLARLAIGIAALLLAQVGSYSVATQAFSDPFVLIWLGVLTGVLLGLPAIAHRQMVRADVSRSVPSSALQAGE